MSGAAAPDRPADSRAPADRPLVTFALLAYNQERFVRDAVRGALAQAYSPMEILLSDDASKDRTFEVMQEEVKGYEGPHEVVLRRNERNLGLSGHLNTVMALARGEIIVPAAGDDVSLPERTPACVAAMRERPGLVAVCCRTRTIDSEGAVRPEWGDRVDLVWEEPRPTREGRVARFIESWKPMILGAANAFRREIYDRFGRFHDDVVNEDVVFTFRAHLLGEIDLVDTVGVHYRKHPGSMSNFERVRMSAWDRARTREESRIATFRRQVGIWRMMAADLASAAGDGGAGFPVDGLLDEIRRRERVTVLLARQPQRSFAGRCRDLLSIASDRAPLRILGGSTYRVLPQPVVLGINALRFWGESEDGSR